MNPLIFEHVAHSPHTNTKLPTVFTLLGAIFYAYLVDKGWSKRPLRECERTTCARWVFKSAKPFLTSPWYTWAQQGGGRRRHCAQPDRLAPVAGAFCRLIRYRYIIGALCVYYSGSPVSACVSRSCFSKIAVITYLLTLMSALFAHSCRDSLLISPPFFHCTVSLSNELARYFLLAANCASLVLFTCSPPCIEARNICICRGIYFILIYCVKSLYFLSFHFACFVHGYMSRHIV